MVTTSVNTQHTDVLTIERRWFLNKEGRRMVEQKVYSGHMLIYSVRMLEAMWMEQEDEPVSVFERTLLGLKERQRGHHVRGNGGNFEGLIRKVRRKLLGQ